MPEALYKIEDPEVRQFVEKCLVAASERMPAEKLLNDPFLQIDGCELEILEIDGGEMGSLIRQSLFSPSFSDCSFFPDTPWGYDHAELEPRGIELFDSPDDETSTQVGITITGRMSEEGRIFLRLRIADKEGSFRNNCISFSL